ncbi:sensor histidine kinase [Actinomadura livida]|uniref:histidine kinase n=1 Tax=Actinomadura livida TaxID=79909 RepID=A0A7W7IBB3_9ACTN|nr:MULTISPECIES: sensor histidine kinase [Actinomadura]MBB4773905.1 signal transduction histidine kinase [Actinomadura catellatispora]
MDTPDSAPTAVPGTGARRRVVICKARPVDGVIRAVVVGLLVTWGLVVYVRDMADADPMPALRGPGLALVLLSAVLFATLGSGLWIGRHRGSSRWRMGIVLLLTSMAAAVTLYAATPAADRGLLFCMAALWALLIRLPLRWGVAVSALAIAMVGGLGEGFRDGADLGLLAAFAGITAGGVASRQNAVAQEATRRAEAANAVLAERSHIAREIHDILAHSLSAQIVHLEGARLLLSRDGDRVQALERVERARNLARSGLEETRRALATLRGEMPEPQEVIAELAEEFYQSTGRPCEVRVTGDPRDLPPQAGLTVVRTAQEALTNVRKHAPGARAHVTLRYLGDKVELEVTDSGGTEPVVAADGGGYGLVGMRERAELIDGTLMTGPDGRGFRVSLRVPV